MCEESSEWMKFGGKPFFCFSVLGFLGTQDTQGSGGPTWGSPLARLAAPWLATPPPGTPQHSLGRVPTIAEREALDATTDLQGREGRVREGRVVSPTRQAQGWGGEGGRTITLESR